MIICRNVLIAMISFVSLLSAQTESTLDSNLREKIDGIARQVHGKPGAPPSASLAIVKKGKIAYIQAYGDASLEPRVAARPEMRYCIGSISKQFTATAIVGA